MDLELIFRVQEVVVGYIISLSLAMPRASGIMLILPVFTRLGLSGIIRAGVAIALAMPMVPMVVTELATADGFSAVTLALLAAKELMIGFMLGVLFGLPFWGAEAAGDIIEFQRGSFAAVMFDPSMGSESAIPGTLFALITIALFVVADGMFLVAEALYQSYLIWPVTALLPSFQPGAALLFLGILDDIMLLGLVLGGPVFIALFFGDLVLGLIGRFAPNLNIFDLSLVVKSIIFAVMMLLYMMFLIDHLKSNLVNLRGLVEQLGRAFQ